MSRENLLAIQHQSVRGKRVLEAHSPLVRRARFGAAHGQLTHYARPVAALHGFRKRLSRLALKVEPCRILRIEVRDLAVVAVIDAVELAGGDVAPPQRASLVGERELLGISRPAKQEPIGVGSRGDAPARRRVPRPAWTCRR